MTTEKILLAADHAGVGLKNKIKKFLEAEGCRVEDLGTDTEAPVDYPDLAHQLATRIEKGKASRGILVCGSGIGMAMAANRHVGVRAAVVTDTFSAKVSRAHNDSNVLCLGARVTPEAGAKELVKTWLETPFEGGRHEGRVKKI